MVDIILILFTFGLIAILWILIFLLISVVDFYYWCKDRVQNKWLTKNQK